MAQRGVVLVHDSYTIERWPNPLYIVGFAIFGNEQLAGSLGCAPASIWGALVAICNRATYTRISKPGIAQALQDLGESATKKIWRFLLPTVLYPYQTSIASLCTGRMLTPCKFPGLGICKDPSRTHHIGTKGGVGVLPALPLCCTTGNSGYEATEGSYRESTNRRTRKRGRGQERRQLGSYIG